MLARQCETGGICGGKRQLELAHLGRSYAGISALAHWGSEEIWKGDDRKQSYDWVMRLKDKETGSASLSFMHMYGYGVA
jgi:prenyltransferase beta subunit